MTSATDLYQEIILNHSRHPRHFGRLENATHHIKADNPLCGDSYEVFLRVDEGGIIRDATFEGAGCAISKASASLMTDAVIGHSIQDFETLFARFHDLVRGTGTAPAPDSMGKLAAFSGIWKFPARVKCAILCWHAARTALAGTTPEGTAPAGTTPEGGVS
jgi:nitrogen fixation NifU-like protein